MRPIPFTNSTYEIIFFSAYGLWVVTPYRQYMRHTTRLIPFLF